MFSRLIEKYAPSSGATACLLGLLFHVSAWDSVFAREASNAFFVIFSISCGFISTSLSILFTLQDRRAVKSLKTSGAFRDIVSYHWRAILWCLTAIIFALLFLLTQYYFKELNCLSGQVMFSAGCGAFLAVLRVVYLFVKVLQIDNK